MYRRIIVGVKYCFRYNARNRQRALGENGEPIDLGVMGPGGRPHRRRREKKLMSMEEVNERFPLIKYKLWRSSREAEGLPQKGGVAASPSRAASLKGESGTIDADTRNSADTTRPTTAIEIAQQDHVNALSGNKQPETPDALKSAEESPAQEGKAAVPVQESNATPAASSSMDAARLASVVTVDEDEDEDDPIRTAAAPEMLAVPGDACAICLDTL